nr:hypothetical protein [Mesorhizobium sp. M7A.F.Ca.ET.027.03.2.1]
MGDEASTSACGCGTRLAGIDDRHLAHAGPQQMESRAAADNAAADHGDMPAIAPAMASV